MKHTNKTLKSIIAMVLTLAIALTGVGFDTMTANASGMVTISKGCGPLQNVYDIENTTITMKVGDVKNFEILKDLGGFYNDRTAGFEFTSSDETVVSVINMYPKTGYAYAALKAEKSGTAVINATGRVSGETFTFTVEVAGATAAQQKCKHSWKTTKKATCLRSGTKTCKKCHLTKTIKQKAHKFVTKDEVQTTYDIIYVYECNACVCQDREDYERHIIGTGIFECDHPCGMQFDERDYGSKEAALAALQAHQAEYCTGKYGNHGGDT
ncbi:MAG: hypothetical protein NC314_14170, partial [Roseburia sp.]|nr:hypothetical protein [Roseburia sp.]